MHKDRIHLQVRAAEVSYRETGEHHVRTLSGEGSKH